ncbi:MAG: type IX secretion system membrane protein PorP/SprF [Bacteroidales bacterium]|nr:type IX secretion system membrane protein PorP/SprF [Bacteroidales bacterium]MDD4684168.1 type IX secretion system membrane protein PorP/SprF [Bacteroidales bacterium]
MKKINLFIFLMISCTASLFAQSDYQYAQVVNNLGWVNPSYHGMSRDITGTFIYANRLNGQMNSESFDIHGGLPYQHLGFGIQGDFNNFGLRKQSIIGVDANIDLRVSCNSYLLFGMFVGYDLWRYDGEAITDVGYNTDLTGVYLPNHNATNLMTSFGATYVYKGFRLGSSLRWSIRDRETIENKNLLTYYGHVEYEFLVNKFSVRPLFVYMWNQEAGSNNDLGAMFGYNNLANIGVLYRATNSFKPKSFAVLADLTIAKSATLFFDYEFGLSDHSSIRSSWELGLRFNLNKALNRESFDKRETIRDFAW